MATNKNNAAEELETAPELEVVEGEATSVVEPEEIEALLEEMAKQNDEDDLATAALAAAEQESTASLEAITESTQAAKLTVAEPELVAEAEHEPEPATTGPSFTMEDVLRAASESTSFSVDEIKNMESEEEEPEAIVEEEFESELDAVELTNEVDKEPVARSVDSRYDEPETAPESEPKTKKAGVKVNMPKINFAFDWKVWLRKPAFIGAAAGVVALVGVMAFIGLKVSKVESKLAMRQKNLESTIEDSKDQLENLNERFASMDRSLQSKGTGHSTNVSHTESNHASTKPVEKTLGATAAKSTTHAPGNSADQQPKPSDEHAAKTEAHKPEPKAHKAPKHTGPSGDHYDQNALVEGFKTSDLLIAKHKPTSHPKPKGKTRTAHARAKAKPHGKTLVASKAPRTTSNSLRIYDANGQPINRITVHAPTSH